MDTPSPTTGDKIIKAVETASEGAHMRADRSFAMQAETLHCAETATIATATAAERIRKLSAMTVLLSVVTLALVGIFAVLFWKFAIVLRLPD